MGKRYFWLKLKDDFFTSKRIKKLRKLAGGDTFTIIYLKLQLKAMKSDGILKWTGLEDDIASELALDLDEEPDNVAVTLQYLLSCGLAETSDNVEYFFPYAVENVGSETASAQRVREFRSRVALQCNAQALQSNADVTQVKRECNVEKERELDIESDIERDSCKRFRPPSVDEVASYCTERKNKVDPQRFVDYYQSKGWMLGKTKMKDWKAAVRTWERRDKDGSARNASGSTAPVQREWNIVYD